MFGYREAEDDVTPTAQDKLRALRQRLAELEPYPWDPVEEWIAYARSLIKEHYSTHADDFLVVVKQPGWYAAIRSVPGPYSSVDPRNQGAPRRDSSAEAAASEARENRKIATAAKSRILAFLDGLLDLPSIDPPVREATGTMSKDRSSLLNHHEILDLQRAVVSAHLGGSRQGLLAGMPANFVASLPDAKAPGEQVLTDLDVINSAGELGNGSVPLLTWLSNAMLLAGGRQEAGIFQEVLERCGGAPPARAQPTAGAAKASAQPAAAVVHHHYGDTHLKSTITNNITSANIKTFAQGDHAVATGHVKVSAPTPLTQEQHKTTISEAQTALVRDQDALERIDERLYEALGRFLTLARKIQVEQQSLGEVQLKMKETLDEVWAQQVAKGMKPQLLPKGLEVVEALAKSPITAEIARKLLGV
jgi:Effector-associated domain 5